MTSWRTSLNPLAPTAPRIAISRSRARLRPTSRLATFAQAMRRTKPATPRRIHSRERTPATASSAIGRARRVKPFANMGKVPAIPFATLASSACAVSSVTPSRSRPITARLSA